jgi:hypothetical protein
MPGRDGGADEPEAEELNSREVELRRRVETSSGTARWPVTVERRLRLEWELEWLVLELGRGFETGLVPTRSGSPIVGRSHAPRRSPRSSRSDRDRPGHAESPIGTSSDQPLHAERIRRSWEAGERAAMRLERGEVARGEWRVTSDNSEAFVRAEVEAPLDQIEEVRV